MENVKDSPRLNLNRTKLPEERLIKGVYSNLIQNLKQLGNEQQEYRH